MPESGDVCRARCDAKSARATRWEHFAHGADVGVRGIGCDRNEAFEQAALALTAAVTDPAGVDSCEEVTVRCEAPDDELLLVDWLNAVVYEMATRAMVFGRFRVRVADRDLEGTAWGERVDVEKHRPAVEVKGATYTSLLVVAHPDGTWLAQCVVDV